MTDFEKQFGANLKKLREAKKLTQEVLAERIGIGPTTLSKMENGKCFVTSDTIVNIIKALNIKPYELFLFDMENPVEQVYKRLLENLKSDKIKNNFTILKLLLDFTDDYLKR